MLVLIQLFLIKQDIMCYNHDILALNVYMMLMMELEDEEVVREQQTLYQLLFVLELFYLEQ